MGNIVQFFRPEDKEILEFVKNSDFLLLKFDEDVDQVKVMTNAKVSFKTLVLSHVAYMAINDYLRYQGDE